MCDSPWEFKHAIWWTFHQFCLIGPIVAVSLIKYSEAVMK
jgi:hypothetical protein